MLTTRGAITIRHGSPEDVAWLLGQLRAFSAFYGTRLPLFGEDEEHAKTVVGTMIRDHLVLVAVSDDGERQGFISGYVIAHPYNPQIRMLSESFWWVDPKFRGTRAGLLLLANFTEWGKANVDWITCVLEDRSPVNGRSLERRGYRLNERCYLLEVPKKEAS